MRARQVERWLIDEVTLAVAGAIDEYGQATTSSSTVAAKVMRSSTRSRDSQGEEFTSTTQVATLATIAVGDLITVDGVARPVRAIKAGVGVRGGASLTVALL
jgi:hypothetical protein